jgi:hypothetical protein
MLIGTRKTDIGFRNACLSAAPALPIEWIGDFGTSPIDRRCSAA